MKRKQIRSIQLTQKYDARCFDGRGQKRGNKRSKTKSNKVVRQAFKKLDKKEQDEA